MLYLVDNGNNYYCLLNTTLHSKLFTIQHNYNYT